MPTLEDALAFLDEVDRQNREALEVFRELRADPNANLVAGGIEPLDSNIRSLEGTFAEIAASRDFLRLAEQARANNAIGVAEARKTLEALRRMRGEAPEPPASRLPN
jgi:hypothetical protein